MVVNIVDASSLERNLYLTLQFMEMGIPVCIALNMIDVAESRGIRIDTKKLSELLRVPVIPTVARIGKGKRELMETVAAHLKDTAADPLLINYGRDIEKALDEIEHKIKENNLFTENYPARWMALKYIEEDEKILETGFQTNPALSGEIMQIVEKLSAHVQATLDTYPEAIIADQRYGYINSLLKQGVIRYNQDRNRLQTSDRIDKVVTNRFLGPVFMIAVLMGLYHFTFTYSELPVSWVESFFAWLGSIAEAHIPEGLLKSLVLSGMIDGVGGVLGFVPLIMFMFFGISLLEDSGYLARVAYMLDRVFRVFGLHGSSVMAFIVSGGIAGGCAVPGVMATRTLKSPKERLATLLTVPFMNCGAKMPVFALLVAAFFAENQATVMIIITMIAWAGALLVAKLLRTTIIKGTSTPFVMELPPYRLPTFKGLLIHTWERTWQYIRKAGTVILCISILLWAMMTFPRLPESEIKDFEQKKQTLIVSTPTSIVTEADTAGDDTKLSSVASGFKQRLDELEAEHAEAALRNSVAGRFGTAMERITRHAGFDWRTNIALVGGFAAKEVIVSTMGTAYSLGAIDPEETGSLSEALVQAPGWRPLTALSLIIFTIFYAPCFVAVVCIAREAGSWKWGAFSMIFNTVLAFGLAVITYQTGMMLGY